ncbi:MAG TPA: sensor domain-containing diguanylate cyclase [Planctomycetota bacterium]|jgi:diguanylate cyclase (GGDEF)-like protein|nr:sensor domain-containing diguanylate cyclase [Planctomycetota bacterium]
MPRKARARRTARSKVAPAAEPPPDVMRLEEENRRLRARLALVESARDGAVAEAILRLHELFREFNTLDLDRIGLAATRKAAAVLRARRSSLYLYDYGTRELVLLAHTHGIPIAERVPVARPARTVMAHALEGRETLVAEDLDAYARERALSLDRPFAAQYATPSCICAPLLTANFIVGVLNFADKEGDAPFDPIRDRALVEQFSSVLAMAIRNCRLFKEVQSQAHTDALTRLGNYRAFHETLRSEMHRAARYDRPLGLIMLDIDSFKEINDRYGHQAGDAALAELGRLVRASIRREDAAARYGGDEIAVILPETRPQGCLMVVQRLMAAVRNHAFHFEGKRLPVTISVGVASFRPDMTITQFVRAADQALYRAKQRGRNRFETADETAPA